LMRFLVDDGEPVVILYIQSACTGRQTPELLIRQSFWQKRSDAR
jgi:hypothetical protein